MSPENFFFQPSICPVEDAVRKYFSDDYSSEEIERIILELLEGWKERQEADGVSDYLPR